MSCTWAGTTHEAVHAQLEKCFAHRDPGVLLDTNLNGSQQRALATKKADRRAGCSGQKISSRSRQVILPLSSPLLLRPPLDDCVQLWAPL